MPGPGNVFRQLALVSDSHRGTHEHYRRRKPSWLARLLSASRTNKRNIDIHIDTPWPVGTSRTISPDPRSEVSTAIATLTAISSIPPPSFSESPSQSTAVVLGTIASTSVTPCTLDSSSLSVSNIKCPATIITTTTTATTIPPGAGDLKPSCSVLPNDSTTTAPLSKDQDIWRRTLEIAEKNLARANLPSICLEDPSLWSRLGVENIQLILQELSTAHDRYRTQKQVSMGKRWGGILKSMEKYAKIVDTAIQHQPEITALVWAGVRALLQVALNHVQAIECFEAIMVTIMDKMATCTFYANIYSEALVMPTRDISKIMSILDSALPELYAAIIVFTVKARIYFEARWLKKVVNMFKPFLDEFQPFIDDISEKEITIRNCADMVIMQTITRHSDTLRQMQNILNAMRTEMEVLVKLNEISQAITQNVDLSKELVIHSLSVESHLLLQQLSPLEPLKRHSDIRSARLKDTGNWLLELNQFRNWRDIQTAEGKNERVLCCYGIPGAGKTVISSLVIDHLRSQVTTQSKTAVVCLYADYRDQGNQTVVHILGALLHQYLTSGLVEIPNEVIQRLTDIKKQNKSVEIEDVLDMLRVTVVQLDRSFVCIDALDELEARTRRELLGILPKALSIGKTSIRFYITGRRHMKSEVQSFFSHSQLQEVDITANLDDIRIYLRYKITQDEIVNSETMNERLRREIETTIVAQSQGMFLLPALHVHMILEQPTIAKRRRVLKDLPPDLHQALEGIVSRIQASRSQSELGMRVLMWLHLASRSLKLRELQHALAIEKSDTRFDEDNIPSRKALLDCCLGLVIVDEETQTVRFVHHSLGEFFHKNSNKYFPNGFSTAAETCLTYLNFPEVRKHCISDADIEKRLEQYSFLEYAAENWGDYLRKQSKGVQHLSAQKILLDNPSEEYCCPRQILHRSMYESIFSRNHRVSGIHVAAFFGLHEMMDWCCDVWGADLRDHIGRTPLLWAASRGHEAVVQLLIDRKDVDLNAKDQISRTPLSLAAGRGHVLVVRLLIERDGVDLNPKSIFGITPLIDAAISGCAAVVQLLIKQGGVDFNAMDEDCRTPLLWAAHMGHEAVVQVLIEQDGVDLNPKSYFNTTPLMLAAREGHKSVVQVLIERDGVDLNAVNGRGRTALAIALLLGHQSIAQILQTKQASCRALPPDKE